MFLNDCYYKKISSATAIEKLREYVKNDAIFKYSALEVIAALYIEEGKFELAKDTLYQISISEASPQDMRIRSKMLLDYVRKTRSCCSRGVGCGYYSKFWKACMAQII